MHITLRTVLWKQPNCILVRKIGGFQYYIFHYSHVKTSLTLPRLITVAIPVMSGHVYLLWIFSRHLFQYFDWNHVEFLEFLSPFYNYWQSMLYILFLFCLALWIFVTYTVFLSFLITSFRYHIRIYLTPNRNPLNKKKRNWWGTM